MIDCRHSPTLHSCFWAAEPGPAVLQSYSLQNSQTNGFCGSTVILYNQLLPWAALLLCPKAERMQVRERNLTS
jgi:hypothetical protein